MAGPAGPQQWLAQKYTAIDSFVGKFAFLANDFLSSVRHPHTQGEGWRGAVPKTFRSATHALLAARHELTEEQVEQIAGAETVEEAKRIVGDAGEKASWQQLRNNVVEQIVRDKFRRNAEIRQSLLETGERKLAFCNKEDSFLGLVDGRGRNLLGRILMEIRDDIKENVECQAWAVKCYDVSTEEATRPLVTFIETKETTKPKSSETFESVIGSHTMAPSGGAVFLMGKLEDCDLQALHPSISRRHAMLVALKTGEVLLFDLGSKASTFLNGTAIEDSVGVPIVSGDTIRLGASTRTYTAKVDTTHIAAHLEKRQRELQREITKLNDSISDPLGTSGKNALRLFLGNLSFKTTREDLVEFFALYGISAESFEFPQNSTSQQGQQRDQTEERATRGMAFVTFETEASAAAATQLDGQFFQGRQLRVKYADLKPVDRVKQSQQFVPASGGQQLPPTGLSSAARKSDASPRAPPRPGSKWDRAPSDDPAGAGSARGDDDGDRRRRRSRSRSESNERQGRGRTRRRRSPDQS